jgi:transposase
MDTSTHSTSTDALGRRSGPRRRRSVSEKRRIVEESLRPGASVAMIARRHEVNANSVFGWRRLYEKGLLSPSPVSLLPVSVVDEPTSAKPRTRRVPRTSRSTDEALVQLDLANGVRVRVQGELARELMRELIKGLIAR